jgi:hypothetical protein
MNILRMHFIDYLYVTVFSATIYRRKTRRKKGSRPRRGAVQACPQEYGVRHG